MNMDSPFRGSSSAAHPSRSVPGGRLYKQAFNFLELSQSTWRQTTQITNKQLGLPSQALDYQARTSLHITEGQNILNYHPEQSCLNISTFHYIHEVSHLLMLQNHQKGPQDTSSTYQI